MFNGTQTHARVHAHARAGLGGRDRPERDRPHLAAHPPRRRPALGVGVCEPRCARSSSSVCASSGRPPHTHAPSAVPRIPGDPPLSSPSGQGSFPCDDTCVPDTVNGVRFVRDLYELANDTGGERARAERAWGVGAGGRAPEQQHHTPPRPRPPAHPRPHTPTRARPPMARQVLGACAVGQEGAHDREQRVQRDPAHVQLG